MVTSHKTSCLLVSVQRECLPTIPSRILGGNLLGAIYPHKYFNVFILNFGGTFEFPSKEMKQKKCWVSHSVADTH